ncbi:MAG: hypothetical protein KC516_02120, partial [Nanoarchaeota archaeon]|nr:hypothetical protein [Nanoarchaeota archaeon]
TFHTLFILKLKINKLKMKNSKKRQRRPRIFSGNPKTNAAAEKVASSKPSRFDKLVQKVFKSKNELAEEDPEIQEAVQYLFG